MSSDAERLLDPGELQQEFGVRLTVVGAGFVVWRGLLLWKLCVSGKMAGGKKKRSWSPYQRMPSIVSNNIAVPATGTRFHVVRMTTGYFMDWLFLGLKTPSS